MPVTTPSYTFAGLRAQIRRLLSPYYDAEAPDPFFIEAQIYARTDEAAQATDAIHSAELSDMTSGTTQYQTTAIYKIASIEVKDSAGLWRWLALTELDQMRKLDAIDGLDPAAQWGNVAASDPPKRAVLLDDQRFLLWPPPSVTRVSGLRVRGWATPGQNWVSGQAITDSSPFPCAPSLFWAVAFAVAGDYLESQAVNIGAADKRIPLYRARWDALIGQMKQNDAEQTPRRRRRLSRGANQSPT